MSALRTLTEGQGVKFTTKIKSGNYLKSIPITATLKNGRLWLDYPYNAALKDEMKVCMADMKWHGYDDKPVKQWSAAYNEHSVFQLEYLAGLNPYSRFDIKTPPDFDKFYPLKQHQYEGVGWALVTHRAIFGYEMGLGKTLMIFEIAKHLKPEYLVWVSTRSALLSVQLEVRTWGFDIPIRYFTYEGFKNYVANWTPGTPAPTFLVGDESHKLKNLTSQRTQTFNHVARMMRQEHGDDAFIALMTGTPAPKSPVDWYSQCQIVQPGFLKEGSVHAFKDRLAIVKKKENTATGGVYPELLAWRDSEKKCDICGQLEDSYEHDAVNLDMHPFKPCVNEVARLYDRMKGLVHIRTKSQCTDLPEKFYQKIYCQPSTKTKQSMKMLATRATGAKLLTLLRELSDGFQYAVEEIGFETCPTCNGSKVYTYPQYCGPEKTREFLVSLDSSYDGNVEPEDFILDPLKYPHLFKLSEEQICPACEGSGEVRKYGKTVSIRTTAKDKALIDILDEHEDVGRLVVYAGFTATLDRLCELVRKQEWDYVKLDGKGFRSSLPGKKQDLIMRFKRGHEQGGKIVFIGNPGAASTGLTLTASPTVVFYSNSFNADDRSQAEDRIHRLGMDENRGAKIIDLIHLPTDEYVIENLQKKKNLQDMSMGLANSYINSEREQYDYTE